MGINTIIYIYQGMGFIMFRKISKHWCNLKIEQLFSNLTKLVL